MVLFDLQSFRILERTKMRSILIVAVLLSAAGLRAETEPRVVGPGEAESLEFPGHLTQVLSSHHDTAAGTSVLELTLPPRTFGAPPHVHSHEDEHFYVLEGQVDFLDRGEVVRAGAGSLAVLPRGHLHGFWNDSDEPARLLLIISPGGFSDFFDEVVAKIREAHPDDPRAVGALVVAAAAERGVTVHFDQVPASALHLLPK
jgi:quercetin dioxygenase-like cupin family protein